MLLQVILLKKAFYLKIICFSLAVFQVINYLIFFLLNYITSTVLLKTNALKKVYIYFLNFLNTFYSLGYLYKCNERA